VAARWFLPPEVKVSASVRPLQPASSVHGVKLKTKYKLTLTHCNANAKIPNFRPSNAAPCGRPPSPPYRSHGVKRSMPYGACLQNSMAGQLGKLSHNGVGIHPLAVMELDCSVHCFMHQLLKDHITTLSSRYYRSFFTVLTVKPQSFFLTVIGITDFPHYRVTL